jgi:hypothetical protein
MTIKLKKILLETPEANPDDIFGEYIFGLRRKDYPARNERDTKEEYKLGSALQSHYSGNVYNSNLSSFIPEIFKLIKKGKYLNFLKPDDKYKTAYRLIAEMNLDEAKKIFNIDFYELLKNKKAYGSIRKKFVYTPLEKHNGLSSWTVELEEKTFVSVLENINLMFEDDHPNVFLMLCADIKNNNFILNPDQIQEKTDLTKFDELEILSYGNVTVNKISYFITDNKNTSEIGQLLKFGDEEYFETENDIGDYVQYSINDTLSTLIQFAKHD